ncbi:MAG: AAA family ATPase, partial [Planctomycetota bacterium]
MLHELHISNLAIIEDLRLELTDGLNVFTGQTGAGKSLVLGAIELLLGRRKAGNLLRPGAGEGRITGVFSISDPETLDSIAELTDLPRTEFGTDDPLLITRKIFESGRSTVAINGHPATNPMLTRIGELLVDMSAANASEAGAGSTRASSTTAGSAGTSISASGGSASSAVSSGDALSLLKPANQLDIVDAFAGNQQLRAEYLAAFRRYREVTTLLETNRTEHDLRAQQLDLYLFQAAEIDEVEPTEGELEELEARYRVLSSLERILREGHTTYAALYESDGAVIERLQAIVAVLRELGEVDESLNEIVEQTEQATASLQDAAFMLNRYLGRQDLDPAELGEITDRLNRLNRLIQKYGNRDLEEVLSYRAEIQAEIEKIRSADADVTQLEAEREDLEKRLTRLALTLRDRRHRAVKDIEPKIEAELNELAMQGTSFRIYLDGISEINAYRASGADSV